MDAVATTIDDVTSTTDVGAVATSTGFTTIITTLGAQATTIVDITLVETDYASTTITSTKSVTLVDRAVGPSTTTIIPSSIPAFASACSGSVRFSSACSCAGVTGSTITLPSPSTTITIPYTLTASTVTSTTTTALATITDSTATLFSTASTETDTITVSTTTVIVPDETSTDTITTATITTTTTDATVQTTLTKTSVSVATATVTQTCANPIPTFALQVVGGAYNGQYLYSTPFYNQNADLATAGTTITAASSYTLTGTVLSEYNGNTLGAPSNVAFTYAEFRTAAYNAAGGDVPFVCSINNGHLTCSLGAATQVGICNISGPVTVFTEPGYYPSGFGCTNVVLNVIPLCIVP